MDFIVNLMITFDLWIICSVRWFDLIELSLDYLMFSYFLIWIVLTNMLTFVVWYCMSRFMLVFILVKLCLWPLASFNSDKKTYSIL
jgi:hypothetical protein